MKRKNVFWPLLALAICFGYVPVIAHAAQEKGAPPAPKAAQPAPPHLSTDQRNAQKNVSGPYRLTYTLTEMDGAKRIGSQRYAIALDADAPFDTIIRLGTKIPVETGFSGANGSLVHNTSYIDLGVNIRAHLLQFANGLELNSHVEQSTVESQQPLPKDPVVRATSIDGTVLLSEGKPVILGNGDMPGSTHSLQVQVELTKIP